MLMIYNGNLWLLTMCQIDNERASDFIKDIYPTFTGIVAVCHNSQKHGMVFQILEQNKGNGKIIKRDFVWQHSHSMNETLFCRHIKNKDWCVWLDFSDRLTSKFTQDIRKVIYELENQNIDSIIADGRVWVWKYNDNQYFEKSPHWFLSGLRNPIQLTKEQKESWFINTRWEKPEISFCLNPIKYWFVYANGCNETQLIYGKYGQNIVEKHEKIRQEFRSYCEFKLNLSLNFLDDLIEYMKKIERKEIIPDEYFINTMENEFRLSELYQLKVLNMNFMGERPNCVNGMHPRYKWSFRDSIFRGDGFYNPNYIGTILKYDKNQK